MSLRLGLSTREAEVWHVEVVESSRRLGDIEASGGSKDEPAQIVRTSMTALAMPI
ncbi:hypothetical protein [Sorangium sp. So ce887]|uniref:hypothetical protein n=1 Tax=Sorangium sp. So ce887 TaxID=3133324 RepID=UPI003F631BD7